MRNPSWMSKAFYLAEDKCALLDKLFLRRWEAKFVLTALARYPDFKHEGIYYKPVLNPTTSMEEILALSDDSYLFLSFRRLKGEKKGVVIIKPWIPQPQPREISND